MFFCYICYDTMVIIYWSKHFECRFDELWYLASVCGYSFLTVWYKKSDSKSYPWVNYFCSSKIQTWISHGWCLKLKNNHNNNHLENFQLQRAVHLCFIFGISCITKNSKCNFDTWDFDSHHIRMYALNFIWDMLFWLVMFKLKSLIWVKLLC